MGNSHNGADGLEGAVRQAESLAGKVPITGRYHRLPKKFEDDYTALKQVLGQGYNGQVYLATQNSTRDKFAVKGFKLHGVSREKQEELQSEAEIFLAMDHPHVARLKDVYEDAEQLLLVMECMEGGELFQRVLKKKRFPERDAAQAVWQMLLAVNYIHSHNIVHRDLKLENFLYEREDSDHLKLIDFGFSKIWDRNTKMDLSCGTLAYVAPEVLDKKYTEKCDMWSLGVITWILLVGYMPFSGSEKQQVQNIKAGKYNKKKEPWSKVSIPGNEFVEALLEKNYERRLSAEQAMEHPWIKSQQDLKEGAVDASTVDALMTFAQASQFKRVCLQVMAWSLTNEERAGVREAFLELDTRKTGTITLFELKTCLHDKFHISDDAIAQTFAALNSSHTEEVHYADFLAAMCSSRIKLHDQLLRETFKRFDTDGSGYITVANLKDVLGETISVNEIEQMLKEADVSGDGKISVDEFMKYLKGGGHDTAHGAAAARVIDKQLEKKGATEHRIAKAKEATTPEPVKAAPAKPKIKEKPSGCGCSIS